MTFYFCNYRVMFDAFHGPLPILCGKERGHDGHHGSWTHVNGRPTT